ncbi:hypothetical protein [Moorena sp. SIO3I6]|uniref:hypothetical protein n=1 Tax=Moorena sp. SIO3I6 TaxID=2607831 RepID=UPI0013F6CFC2|nr:hypothetical protein [Moorena sp. SIO3I6]NEP29016.1 hypothetical protein [Moorena sp. SIO3I6]
MGLTESHATRLTKSHAMRSQTRDRSMEFLCDRKQGIGLGSYYAIDQKSRYANAKSQNRKSSLSSAILILSTAFFPDSRLPTPDSRLPLTQFRPTMYLC